MDGDQILFDNALRALFIIAPPTFVSLRFLQAPYGKHSRPGWGPTIPAAMAWFFMESPTVWLTLLLFSIGRHASHPKALSLVAVYLFHYIHRTFVYPLRLHLRRRGGDFPLSIALMAFVFNLLNAYVQGRWVSQYADYGGSDGWFWWVRFAAGLAVFGWGMAVNIGSDLVLTGLKEGGGGYKIPRGGWFELVSCPNYFGEVLEWLGWAVMTWSWAGLAFFLYTCANLVPRARANHLWYLDKFAEDYPRTRKAVIPYLY